MSTNATMPVPFFDLREQYQEVRRDVEDAIQKVFESQQFILGPEVAGFEKEVAQYCGCQEAIAVSSGTDALLIALMAIDIKPGDEVITSPFTFFATAGSIVRLGAKPVFVDVDPVSQNIDSDLIESKITKRTRAIMPVHIFGQCVDMDKINEIAGRHDLYVIEDAAQAIGAQYKGRRAGAIGGLGCFSFFPTKNLGACGEGGLVTSNDKELAERVRMLRAHGARNEYQHERVGGNFRMHGLQGAILRAKLKYLDGWNEKRRNNAALYRHYFEASGVLADGNLNSTLDGKVIAPVELTNCTHIYHQYVIRVQQRDALIEFLKERQIGCKVYYPTPLHQQECFADFKAESNCPVSEQLAKEVLALPIFPELSEQQIKTVAESIADFLKR